MSHRTSGGPSDGHPAATGQHSTEDRKEVDKTVIAAQVDRAVEVLAQLGMSASDDDRRTLTGFASSGVDVAAEAQKWCNRARRDPPRSPWRAFEGWLKKAPSSLAADGNVPRPPS
jgi:hypothetical protein